MTDSNASWSSGLRAIPKLSRKDWHVNPNQQRSPWVVALLSIGMGIALVIGGGWMLAHYFVCPEVEAVAFSTAEHDGRYIQLNATKAYEVGFQVEYSLSDPGSKDDPANRVARLVAVPVGSRVLIVRIPMDHQGRSYTGVVKELTTDIEMGLVMDTANSIFRDLDPRSDSLHRDRSSRVTPGTTIGLTTETSRRTPSLQDLALPVYLDAKEDERWAASLVIAVGLASAVGGIVMLLRSNTARSDDVASTAAPLQLDRPITKFQIVCETNKPKGGVDFEPIDDGTLQRGLAVRCPHGHPFEVKMMYRGAARKCPECGVKVDVPTK